MRTEEEINKARKTLELCAALTPEGPDIPVVVSTIALLWVLGDEEASERFNELLDISHKINVNVLSESVNNALAKVMRKITPPKSEVQ